MKEVPAADKTLATIGAICWSVQVLPQIVKSYRTKSTDGLSPILMFIWAVATIFQGSYLVSMRSSIPLQVQPQAFGAFATLSWAQCLYYGSGYTKLKAGLCMLAFYCFFVGFELGSVYALWAGQDRGIEWPTQMYGWITSGLLIIGLLPQYYEIYKHKEVVGISILFMVVDIGGGIFSGISLFFRNEFDSTAFVQYMLVVLLDGAIVVIAPILNPRAKRRREREAALAAEEERNTGVEQSTPVEGATEVTTVETASIDEKTASIDEKRPTRPTGFPLGLGQGEDGRTFTATSEVTAVDEEDKKE